MVEGKFYGDPGEAAAPMVPAVIAWDQAVQTPSFILDTGFSGDIAVTKELGEQLGLDFNTVMTLGQASGEFKAFPVANAIAKMEGQSLLITAILVKGKPLMGITFMEKFRYKATVDCKNKIVRLEVVE